MPIWPSPTLSSGFTHVSDSEPANPSEGETWYDTNANEAKVYDGVSWQRLTVTDHGELGSVSAGQHRSDSNILSVVDGVVDAATVDGQDASELGSSVNAYNRTISVHASPGETVSDTVSVPGVVPTFTEFNIGNTVVGSYTAEVRWSDGSSQGRDSNPETNPSHGEVITEVYVSATVEADSNFGHGSSVTLVGLNH